MLAAKVGLALAAGASVALGVPCIKFKDRYENGKAVADPEKGWWGSAFKYVERDDPAYELAYQMGAGVFTAYNNDRVTQERITQNLQNVTDTGKCHLGDYEWNYHWDEPKKNNLDFKMCLDYKDNACCKADTIPDGEAIKNLYGEEWAWDTCGPMSEECNWFFIAENCLYECDVNAGLFRKYHEANGNYNGSSYHPNHGDLWELEGMPIKQEFFDGMYQACQNEFICDGTFKECNEFYLSRTSSAPTPSPTQKGLSSGAIAALVLASIFMLVLLGCVCQLIKREKQGNPLFAPGDYPDKPARNEISDVNLQRQTYISDVNLQRQTSVELA